MSKYANIDSPKSPQSKNSSLPGKPGFTHSKQPQGKSIGVGSTYGRGVGGADHHKGSTFGGKADCFRGAGTSPTSGKYGGQEIK